MNVCLNFEAFLATDAPTCTYIHTHTGIYKYIYQYKNAQHTTMISKLVKYIINEIDSH